MNEEARTSVRGAGRGAVDEAGRARHAQVAHGHVAVAVHAVAGRAVVGLLGGGAGGVTAR